jgi:hypothetical protein
MFGVAIVVVRHLISPVDLERSRFRARSSASPPVIGINFGTTIFFAALAFGC